MVEVALLGVLQGVAEFLPISSSGHLVLGKAILGVGDVGMRLDIFLHVGTLVSVFVFYFSVIRRIVTHMEWPYVAKVALSAIPIGIVGILFRHRLADAFASPALMFLSAWIPSISGIVISISTRSGFNSLYFSTAFAPFSASPATL